MNPYLNPEFIANRKIINKKHKYRCKVCKAKNRIVTHHIDGDNTNNNLHNLLTLCQSCHIKLYYKKNFKIMGDFMRDYLKATREIENKKKYIIDMHPTKPEVIMALVQ